MIDIAQFYQNVPPGLLDIQQIQQSWQALPGGYDVNSWKLPLPFWGQRSYDHLGNQVWEVLQQDLLTYAPQTPMCIYLHIPFCSSKCGFCDSYSFALSSSKSDQKQQYADYLLAELELWGDTGNLGRRPVSSVHLGGGTPTFLSEEQLTRLVYRCIDRFEITPATEWALESNTTCLTPNMIATLHELGFRRLHIGVQSLEESVRKIIGRRQPAADVLKIIRQMTDLGWIVSVDLIVGLPGQTLMGVLDELLALIDVGTAGVSLYELLIYPQNRKWAERHHLLERDHLPNYLLFQAGAQLLEAHGFRKNLFNHWALERDQNIYFTFPMRGEDLLAVGCLADGVFGDYHYRHLGYAEYCANAINGRPGLMGGLRRSATEKKLTPLILAIQSGRIRAGQVDPFCALLAPNGQPLLDVWSQHHLIEKTPGGDYDLSTSGSWFAGNMISDLSAAVREHEAK